MIKFTLYAKMAIDILLGYSFNLMQKQEVLKQNGTVQKRIY